jgi:PAS domain S-box-containing protein
VTRWRRRLAMRQPTLRMLITGLIVVMILPFIGSAIFVIVRLSDAEHESREAQGLGIARAFSSEVDRQLLSAEAALHALATSPQLQDGDLASFYRQSRAVAEQHGARLILADATGRQIFNTERPIGSPLPQLNQTELARAAAATQRTQISNLFRGSTTDDYLIGVFVPVIEGGTAKFILVIGFRPERLSRLFAEQHVPDDWTITIVDRNGTLIGRNHALDEFIGKPAAADLKAAMDASREGLATLHIKDGVEVYTAFTRSAISGWTVAFGIPRPIVEAPLRRSLVEIGIAAGLVMILCGSIALLTARRIGRSMATLSSAALQLGNGRELPQLTPRIKEMAEVVASLRTAAATLGRRSEERDQAEAALRESEERFRDFAEVSADWIWESDAEHRFTLFTGGNLERMTPAGLTPETSLGKTRWQVADCNPEEDALWREHRADLDARRPFRRFQYSMTGRSATRFCFSVSGKPVFDDHGQFCGYRGTATDVTDVADALRRAESAEVLLRDAVDSISEGFVIYDREDRFVMCNDAYWRIFPESMQHVVPGTPYEELLRTNVAAGRLIISAFPEEWIAQKLNDHRKARDAVELQLDDGRWILVTDRRMRNGGISGLRIDITALKRVQMALRESEERLNRAQRLAAVGSDLRDLRTGEREWSDESYRIFGVTREKFVPTQENVFRLIHPHDQPIVMAARAKTAVGICPPANEYRIIRPDGQVRHLHREWELIRDDTDRPIQLFGTIHDVTEMRAAQAREKELERQLMHSQKLEALGTLAGGVAHDLNNTLVPILALSKLALDELPENTPVRSDIEIIISASEHARDLVKQILAFSRKQPLAKREVDLAQVIREALRMLRASLPATIQILEQLSQVPPLFGDATELHQIVVNLVTNAAQAIGGEVGRITISIWSADEPPGSPKLSAAGSVIYLSVGDTGCGMDRTTVDRIFEPFFTTREVGGGTGLGLSVVHGIVTDHGGSIVVHSQPGEGTKFILSFPGFTRLPEHGPIETAVA